MRVHLLRWGGSGLICLTLGTFVGAPHPARAREYGQQIEIRSAEELYEMAASGEIEAEDVTFLVSLLERPLNLNRADRESLYELPGVSYALADAIIEMRARRGALESIDDLMSAPGMTPELAMALEPFVSFGRAVGLGALDESDLSAEAKLGSIWRAGLPIGRSTGRIDATKERLAGPQGYLLARGAGASHFEAGLLATYRRRTRAAWDLSSGRLVSRGPGNRFDLEAAYGVADYQRWRVVVGSYEAGFAERLTFSNAVGLHAYGIGPSVKITQDNESGRLRPKEPLTGLAVSLLGIELPAGWMDLTGFLSYQRRDLAQYDFWWGLDAWHSGSACQTDGDCPDGYSCDPEYRTCRSSRLYNETLDGARYSYETYQEAFTEGLLGGNATFSFDERTRLGVTGYLATAEFNLAKLATPSFAPTRKYPRKDLFGAVGLDGRLGYDRLDLAGEYAFTGGEGHAGFFRATLEPRKAVELRASLRYYAPDYENPYGRGEAARDETLGLASRNEWGARLGVTARVLDALVLSSEVDVWQNPYAPVYTPAGELQWKRLASAPTDLRLVCRLGYAPTRRESVGVLADYANKDLAHNTRVETYERGDLFGRGERRKLQLSATTTRIRSVRISTSYMWAWQDVTRYKRYFDREERLRVRVSATPNTGTLLVVGCAWWRHHKKLNRTTTSDRQSPALDLFLDFKQSLFEHVALRARYGVLHYRENDPDRYAWYQLAKLTLEARY